MVHFTQNSKSGALTAGAPQTHTFPALLSSSDLVTPTSQLCITVDVHPTPHIGLEILAHLLSDYANYLGIFFLFKGDNYYLQFDSF